MVSEGFVIIWIISALVGAVVGQSKGKGGTGFVLGLLLGLIGVLITALLPKSAEKQAADLGAARQAFGVPTAPQGGWWPDPMGVIMTGTGTEADGPTTSQTAGNSQSICSTADR